MDFPYYDARLPQAQAHILGSLGLQVGRTLKHKHNPYCADCALTTQWSPVMLSSRPAVLQKVWHCLCEFANGLQRTPFESWSKLLQSNKQRWSSAKVWRTGGVYFLIVLEMPRNTSKRKTSCNSVYRLSIFSYTNVFVTNTFQHRPIKSDASHMPWCMEFLSTRLAMLLQSCWKSLRQECKAFLSSLSTGWKIRNVNSKMTWSETTHGHHIPRSSRPWNMTVWHKFCEFCKCMYKNLYE